MPELDDFLLGDGGQRKPGARFEVDDFLLEVPATPQTQPQGPVTVLPREQAQDPRELLSPDSFLSDSAQAMMITAGETATGALNKFADPRVQQMVDAERPSTEALREEFPIATMAGDVLPALTVPGGGIVGGGAAGALISDDPVTGALFGAAGGALGVLGSRVLMRSITPFPRGIGSGLSREAKQLARKLGIKVELADRTGSKSLKNATSALRRNPLASGSFDVVDEANQAAFNRAALSTIGVKGDRITDATIEGARKTLSDGFEELGKTVKRVEVNDAFGAALDDLLDEARLSLSADSFSVVERNINKVLDTVGRAPDGRALTNLSSALGKRAVRLSKSGGLTTDAGDMLFDLKNIVDDLFEANAGGAAKRKLTDLRAAWANLRILRERNVVVGGNVDPGRVRSVLQAKDPDAYRLGGKEDNPLFQMARLHEEVRELIPNSGTPTGQAFEPGNLLTSIPQREAAKLLNSPVFKFLASNNLLPPGVQDALSRAASRAGTVGAVEAFE